VIDLAEVSFLRRAVEWSANHGCLESQVIGFDTVIVTSMNEESFLPENLKFVYSVM
jgi:hypothetical protein